MTGDLNVDVANLPFLQTMIHIDGWIYISNTEIEKLVQNDISRGPSVFHSEINILPSCMHKLELIRIQ